MNKHKKDEKGISTIIVGLVLLVVALSGIIVYMAHDHRSKSILKTPVSNTTTALHSSDNTSQIGKINSVISQGNYHGLAPYMASSVKVVKEGTDANGSVYSSTSAAAKISDYYSQSNTSQGAGLPWDFTSDNAYKVSAAKSNGAVKEYIPQGHIAVSKNNWVLAYNLDSNQMISSFYMSPSVNMSK